QAVGALQVVEAVAVLQVLELLLEHVVERRSEQTTVRVRTLGEAADPEVDVVETAGRVGAPGGSGLGRPRREYEALIGQQQLGTRAAVNDGRLAGDERMRRVCGDEIPQRLRMPQALAEVEPVLIGRERGAVGQPEQLPPRVVQRRDAFAASARD